MDRLSIYMKKLSHYGQKLKKRSNVPRSPLYTLLSEDMHIVQMFQNREKFYASLVMSKKWHEIKLFEQSDKFEILPTQKIKNKIIINIHLCIWIVELYKSLTLSTPEENQR